MSTLRIVLWDQLSIDIASLRDIDIKQDFIFFCEISFKFLKKLKKNKFFSSFFN